MCVPCRSAVSDSLQPHGPKADSLPPEPPGKPMNTGVGSLSLLQGIFPTEESNQGLLCCRQILYQLSYQGSIRVWIWVSHLVLPNSLQPHGLQPTRLLCPWDFPGKNVGVGCHFFLQGIFLAQGWNPGLLHCRQILYQLSYQESVGVWVWVSLSVLPNSLQSHGLQPTRLLYPGTAAHQAPLSRDCSPPGSSIHGLQPTRLLYPWDFPGKNGGVGFHFLLQGIFLAQGWIPGLLHCRQILYRLSYKGSQHS